jgi:hypothetical protein
MSWYQLHQQKGLADLQHGADQKLAAQNAHIKKRKEKFTLFSDHNGRFKIQNTKYKIHYCHAG